MTDAETRAATATEPTVASADEDGTTLYAVRPGAGEIAGRKLRGATEIRLYPAEAEYGLSIGSLAAAGDWPSTWGNRPASPSA